MQRSISTIVFAGLVGGALATPLQAADTPWVIRAGAAHVSPQDSSGDVAGFPGNGVSVDASTGVGLSVSYMVTPHLGVEVLGALPFKHKVNAEGPDLGGLGHIADVRHLPPTLLLNYHMPMGSGFAPYVGVGVNHTFFFEEKASGSLKGALGASEIHLDSSTGLALQAGFDWDVTEDDFFNVALWYVDIGTTATIDFAGGPASGDQPGRTSVDVDIDPFVLMVGFGHRF